MIRCNIPETPENVSKLQAKLLKIKFHHYDHFLNHMQQLERELPWIKNYDIAGDSRYDSAIKGPVYKVTYFAKKLDTMPNESVHDAFAPVTTQSTPNRKLYFEKIKERELKREEKTLRNINAQLRELTNATNTIRSKAETKEMLESLISQKRELEKRIDVLKSQKTATRFAEYPMIEAFKNQDFAMLDSLLNVISGERELTADEIDRIEKTIAMWEAISNIATVDDVHPLLDNAARMAVLQNYIQSRAFRDLEFGGAVNMGKTARALLDDYKLAIANIKVRKFVEAVISTPNVVTFYGIDTSVSPSDQKEQIKKLMIETDTNIAERIFGTLSLPTSSVGIDVIPIYDENGKQVDSKNEVGSSKALFRQVAVATIFEYFDNAIANYNNVMTRIDALLPNVKKKLNNNYEVLLQKTKRGRFTKKIIHRFSPEYFKAQQRLKKELSTQINFQDTDDIKAAIQALRDNNHVIHPGLIPEIISDPEYDEINTYFKSTTEADDFKNDFIATHGLNAYNEMVTHQKNMMNEYILMLKSYQSNSIGNTQLINTELDEFIKTKSPFPLLEEHYNNSITGTNYNTAYVHFVPRRTKLSDGSNTNFYDSAYQAIDDDSELYEFHKLITEVLDDIFFTVNDSSKVKRGDIPVHSMGLIELFNLDKVSFNTITSTKWGDLFRDTVKNISQSLSIGMVFDAVKGTFTFDNEMRTPEDTGEEREPSKAWAKNANKTVTQQAGVAFLEIKALLIKENYANANALSKGSHIELRDRQTGNIIVTENVVKAIAKYTDIKVSGSVSEMVAQLEAELGASSVNIYSEIQDYFTNEAMQTQSFDLPMLVKAFSIFSQEYAARQKAIPILKLLREEFAKTNTAKLTATGSVAKEDSGTPAKEVLAMFDDWVDRVIYQEYDNNHSDYIKAFFEKHNIRYQFLFDFTSWVVTRLSNSTGIRRINNAFSFTKSYNNTLIKKIDVLLAQPISSGEKGDLIKLKSTLGSYASIKAFTEKFLLPAVRVTYLGLSVPVAVMNYLDGQTRLYNYGTTASLEEKNQMLNAMNIATSGRLISLLSFGLMKPHGYVKARNLMMRYRTLQDSRNEFQRAASAKKSLSFDWYTFNTEAEIMNQMPILITTLKNIQITGINGETSSVFDAMNSDGTLKSPFDTQENKHVWELGYNIKTPNVFDPAKNFTAAKNTMLQKSIELFGNYESRLGMGIKDTTMGKVLMTFKTYIPMIWHRNFALPHDNLLTGEKGKKGHMLVHSPITGGIAGLAMGLAFTGNPFGLAAASVIGSITASMLNKGTVPKVSNIEHTFAAAQTILLKSMGIDVVKMMISGVSSGMNSNLMQTMANSNSPFAKVAKGLVTSGDYVKSLSDKIDTDKAINPNGSWERDDNGLTYTETDARVFKSALNSIALQLQMTTIYLIALSFANGDEEDDDDSDKEFIANIIMNMANSVHMSETIGLNAGLNFIFGTFFFPVAQWMTNTAGFFEALTNDTKYIQEGPNAYELDVINKGGKLLPKTIAELLSYSIYKTPPKFGFGKLGDRVFQPRKDYPDIQEKANDIIKYMNKYSPVQIPTSERLNIKKSKENVEAATKMYKDIRYEAIRQTEIKIREFNPNLSDKVVRDEAVKEVNKSMPSRGKDKERAIESLIKNNE